MTSCKSFGSKGNQPGAQVRKQGFTLIELLVVIAIIAILAAILFPVFARARESARKSSCASNLKQLGQAVIMYTQDYDEAFPKCWDAGDYTGSGWTGAPNMPPDGIWWDGAQGGSATTYAPGHYIFWGQMLFPYTKNSQIVDCPNGMKEWQSVDNSKAYRAKYGLTDYRIHYWGQYGSNTFLINSLSGSGGSGVSSGTTPGFPTQHMTKLQSPSNIYMLMDWSGYYADAGSAVAPYWANWSAQPRGVYCPGAGKFIGPGYSHIYGAGYWPMNDPVISSDHNNGRHAGGINIVYADGHVKFNSADKVVAEAKKAVSSPVQPNSWTHTTAYNG